jgi:hypothetical protein
VPHNADQYLPGITRAHDAAHPIVVTYMCLVYIRACPHQCPHHLDMAMLAGSKQRGSSTTLPRHKHNKRHTTTPHKPGLIRTPCLSCITNSKNATAKPVCTQAMCAHTQLVPMHTG